MDVEVSWKTEQAVYAAYKDMMDVLKDISESLATIADSISDRNKTETTLHEVKARV